jgi:hypothetical protein
MNVWRAANLAGSSPAVDRVDRIWEKEADPGGCLVVARLDASRAVPAMALAEPGRAEHGAGAVIPGYGHCLWNAHGTI